MAVHGEKGILATTLRDIAARADVAPSTVLAHFPTLESLVKACGKRTSEVVPFPTADIFDRLDSLTERAKRFVEAVFAYYEVAPPLDLLERDRPKLPPLDAFLRESERSLHQLAREALRPIGSPLPAVNALEALVQYGVWKFLRGLGLSTPQASSQVSEVVRAWLSFQWTDRAPSRPTERFPRKGA